MSSDPGVQSSVFDLVPFPSIVCFTAKIKLITAMLGTKFTLPNFYKTRVSRKSFVTNFTVF